MIETRAAEAFLDLDRIAVVGVSADERKFGNAVYRSLRDAGKQVVAINPKATTVAGDACYPTIADVPGGVDGAVVMTSASSVADAVRSCLEAGVKRIWLFQGIGGSGSVSPEALQLCADAGVEVIAGACPLMFLDPVGAVHRFHRSVRRMKGAVSR